MTKRILESAMKKGPEGPFGVESRDAAYSFCACMKSSKPDSVKRNHKF